MTRTATSFSAFLLFLIPILILSTCASLEAGGDTESRMVDFRTLSQGTQGGVDNAGFSVVRTPAEWENLKEKLPDQTLQAVSPDFPEETVIGVFLGQRPTGGYSVTIEEVVNTGEHIEVRYQVSEPAPGSMNIQVLTFPYHLIVIPHQDAQIVFRQINEP